MAWTLRMELNRTSESSPDLFVSPFSCDLLTCLLALVSITREEPLWEAAPR